MTEAGEDKVIRITEVLHGKVYGGYNEFEEETMGLSEDMRLIERFHVEMDEIKRSREEAVFMAGQRLRDTVRNILRLGQPVEQVVQWTGLPLETVQALAAQL